MYKKLLAISFLLCLIILPGCLKVPTYKAKKLPTLSKETAQFNETKKDITVRARKLNLSDCNDLFGEYNRFSSPGYRIVPLQLTVENNSTKSWNLSDEHITLQQMSPKRVTWYLQSNVLGIACGYTGWSLLTGSISAMSFPFFILGIGNFGVRLSGHYIHIGPTLSLAIPFGITCIGGAIATCSLLSLGIYRSIKASKINEIISQDIHDKTIATVIIKPHSVENRLLFVRKKDWKNNFDIVLHDNDQKSKDTITFNVVIPDYLAT